MVESFPSCQRRPPLNTNKGMSDESADAAALTYSLTGAMPHGRLGWVWRWASPRVLPMPW